MKSLPFCICVVLFLTVLETHLSASASISGQSGYYMPTIPPRTGISTKRSYTCACDEASSQPLCASNGITYKTQCNFDCAKKRVPRLHIVRSGPCGSLNKNDYWNSGKSSKRM